MDTILTWAKENYDLICLMVGVVGVVIAVIAFIDEIKKKKEKKEVIYETNRGRSSNHPQRR